jgi:hypothetical protein
MKKVISAIVIIVLLGIAALTGYNWWQQQHQQSEVVTEVAPPPIAAEPVTVPPAAETPPPILHPIAPPPAPTEPLPTVQDSDQALGQALSDVVGASSWRALFFPDLLIRHIVATVDNLPRHEAPSKMWPLHPAGSWLATKGTEGSLTLDPANAKRYAPYMAVVQQISVDKLVTVYRQFYALFQQAYVELGYPDAYFNDRLVVAIDDMLAAPEPQGPIELIQNKVRYQFADADLESRSAGQKIMLRIGVENARIVKAKLRKLRAAITQAAAVPR